MAYNSYEIKKEYDEITNKQRGENLTKLRKMYYDTQLEFAQKIGFTTKDTSSLENGAKHLSLFHIHAYKKFFYEEHGLDVSVDYLMGYTPIMRNISSDLPSEFGLSPEALETIKQLNLVDDTNINLNPIFNQFICNERVLRGVLWNLYMYSHAEEFLLYLRKDKEDEAVEADEIELSDLFFVVDDKGHNIQLDCEIFETIAERNILQFLQEFKYDFYSESEGD